MELNVITSDRLSTFEAQARLFRMLIHPVRLAILHLLRDGEHCVCHLEAHLGFRQAYISQQVAVLREAGLIKDRREGWNIFYSVVDARIFAVLDAAALISGNNEPLAHVAVACPCPTCSGASQP